MEHSHKRRRLSPRAGRPYHFHSDEMLPVDGERAESIRPRLQSRSYGSSTPPKFFADDVPHLRKRSTSSNVKLSALHPRNFIATQVEDSVKAPQKTVVSSVIQVVVNDGTGTEVTELLVPVKTKVISVPGFAPITLANNPAPTALPNSGGYQNSVTAHAAASSRAAQTVQASRTPSSAAPNSSPVSSNPMSISVAGSQSQSVLSSPPSTPSPSTPSPSSSSSSTGSYFSSSAVPASSSPQTSTGAHATNGQPFISGNSTSSSKPSPCF